MSELLLRDQEPHKSNSLRKELLYSGFPVHGPQTAAKWVQQHHPPLNLDYTQLRKLLKTL
jgi:hypothetical protein